MVTPRPELSGAIASRGRQVDNAENVQVDVRRKGIRQIWTDHRWGFILVTWLAGIRALSGLPAESCGRTARNERTLITRVGWTRAAQQAGSSLELSDVDLILASGLLFSPSRWQKSFKGPSPPFFLLYRPVDEWKISYQPLRLLAFRREGSLLARVVGSIPFFLGVFVFLRYAWRARNTTQGILPLALLTGLLAMSISGTSLVERYWVPFVYCAASATYPVLDCGAGEGMKLDRKRR